MVGEPGLREQLWRCGGIERGPISITSSCSLATHKKDFYSQFTENKENKEVKLGGL